MPRSLLPSLAASLAVALCPAALAQSPASAFDLALNRYQASPSCIGAPYDAALAAIDDSLLAYQVGNPANVQASVAAGVLAAAQQDRLAAAAAAKRCKLQALENWRHVMRTFDGPAFASFQRRAVAGTRALRNP